MFIVNCWNFLKFQFFFNLKMEITAQRADFLTSARLEIKLKGVHIYASRQTSLLGTCCFHHRRLFWRQTQSQRPSAIHRHFLHPLGSDWNWILDNYSNNDSFSKSVQPFSLEVNKHDSVLLIISGTICCVYKLCLP